MPVPSGQHVHDVLVNVPVPSGQNVHDVLVNWFGQAKYPTMWNEVGGEAH